MKAEITAFAGISMKLWDKGYSIDKKIELFTVGNDREIDMHIAKYDVEASRAHAVMLESIGIISSEELEQLKSGLNILAKSIEDIRILLRRRRKENPHRTF